MKVSIITIVNNFEIYNRMLLPSLKKQEGIDFELIEIDNSKKQYLSLAEAWNFGVQKSSSEFLLFCHPDIAFESKFSLRDIIYKCNDLIEIDSKFSIFGGAGVDFFGNGFMTFVHGDDKVGGKDKDITYKEVQTVDACCFIIRRNVFEIDTFSSYLTGFHMCIEDYCLKIKKYDLKTIVIPMNIWHLSKGSSLDYTYYRETIKVLKHNRRLSVLNTTSFSWKINSFIYFKLKFYEIRNYIHHWIIGK